jgi:hypothetical protein
LDNREIIRWRPIVALAFLGGAAAEVVATLLLALKSGTRDVPGREGMCQADGGRRPRKAKEARAALDETSERGKHVLAKKAADVEAATKAGRETMKEKMVTCCS